MRILILTSVYPPLGYGGHDERCRQTVQVLAGLGHQLQILTSNHRLPPMGIMENKGIYRQLRLYPKHAESASFARGYSAIYAHEWHNVSCLEHRLSRFKPDVVYIWNMHGLSKSLLFRLQNRGQRVIYDLHSDWLLPESFHRDPWYRWWFDNSSKRSRGFRFFMRSVGRARRVLGVLPIGTVSQLDFQGSYVISHWLREHLVAGGLDKVKALPVIYPGTDPGKLFSKKQFAGCRHFVWAGRLNEGKGVDVAIDAIHVLRQRGIEVSLDLFGMGEPSERKAKRERIQSLGLIDQITMRGIRPGELATHYPEYDALLYTSRRGEPFSMTVLEAMFSKLPCLIADVGGNQELLADGQDALLFEADNPEALADVIATFLHRKDAGRELAENTLEKWQAELGMDAFCRRIAALLDGRD